MSKKVKVCLALFLSLAVIAQYSFTPQAMVAYGTEEGNVTAAEESGGDSGESSEQKASSSSHRSYHREKELDNMRGFDPASEDDMDDNGMQRYFDANDDEAWD